MEKSIKGIILVDLQAGEGWNQPKLPLHMSMTPSFLVDDRQVSHIERAMDHPAHSASAFMATGADLAFYDEDGEQRPVREITDAVEGEDLRHLHDHAMDIVTSVTDVDMTYMGEVFLPHVSHRNGLSIDYGQTFRVDALTFAIKTPLLNKSGNWVIRHVVKLGKTTRS